SVSGTVDLRGTPSGRLLVSCAAADELTDRFHLVAPVAPDGTFTLSGVSVGPIRVGLSIQGRTSIGEDLEFQARPASLASITDLRLTATTSGRGLDIIVRSTVAASLDGAQVILLSGKQPVDKLRTVGDLNRFQGTGMQTYFAKPVVGENVPRPVLDKLRGGDL